MEKSFPGLEHETFDLKELLSEEERDNVLQAPMTGWIGGTSKWNDLLPAPAPKAVAGVLEGQTTNEQSFIGVAEGALENASGLRGDLDSGAVWSAAQAELHSNQRGHLHVDEAVIVEENMRNLPLGVVHPKNTLDTLGISQNIILLSSSDSCGRVESPSFNSGNKAEKVSSNSHCAILTSCSDQRATHLEADYASSVLASRRSSDNFVEPSKIFGDKTSDEIDRDAKRETRKRRNRESAARSRQKNKAHVKQLETDCHAKALQITSLEDTLVSTLDQNNALQKELSQYKYLNLSTDSLAKAGQITILESALVSTREQNDALQKELAQYRCVNRSGLQLRAMELAEPPRGNENDELKQTTPRVD